LPLVDRYPELVAYRFEGLKNVRARFVDDFSKVPARVFFPTVWPSAAKPAFSTVSLGPWRIGGVLPSFIVAGEALKNRSRLKVLDIGCSDGALRDFFRSCHPAIDVEYIGIDIAPLPAADFPVYAELSAIPQASFDLIMMSEVAEHMTADECVDEYLSKLGPYLADDGIVVVGTPNPLAPAVLHRDVTHVQHYPWYDLYAILRLFFEHVRPLRTHFVTSPRRLAILPFKICLSYLLEVDWCEGLTMIASRAKSGPAVRLHDASSSS
jgi:SAM-dependent methyltransferase